MSVWSKKFIPSSKEVAINLSTSTSSIFGASGSLPSFNFFHLDSSLYEMISKELSVVIHVRYEVECCLLELGMEEGKLCRTSK